MNSLYFAFISCSIRYDGFMKEMLIIDMIVFALVGCSTETTVQSSSVPEIKVVQVAESAG